MSTPITPEQKAAIEDLHDKIALIQNRIVAAEANRTGERATADGVHAAAYAAIDATYTPQVEALQAELAGFQAELAAIV